VRLDIRRSQNIDAHRIDVPETQQQVVSTLTMAIEKKIKTAASGGLIDDRRTIGGTISGTQCGNECGAAKVSSGTPHPRIRVRL